MKKPSIGSPYSMMYLVTPAIYEKLLLCIDEGDKKIIDSLNKPPEEQQERRPAQVIIDAVSSQEMTPIPSSSSIPQVSSVPVAVSVHSQENLPPPAPTVLNVNPPIPPPIVVSTPQVVNPIKPLAVEVATDMTKPAVIAEPIAGPRVGDFILPDLPESEEEEEMDEQTRGLKRNWEGGEESETKKYRPNELFRERDARYRDAMLGRIKKRQRFLTPGAETSVQPFVYDPNLDVSFRNNPLSALPRDAVQWQPIQCVDNTTGGQLCTADSKSEGKKIAVRKDIFLKPYACNICGVRLGNSQMLQMHMRLKHKLKGWTASNQQVGAPIVRQRFAEPGRQTPAQPLVYDPDADVSFRKKSLEKKRFTEWGNEPLTQPLDLNPSQDVSFRKKGKKKNITALQTTAIEKRGRKHIFRCPICQVALGNLSLLKDHIRLKHKLDPKEVIEGLGKDLIASDQATSRDFTDWGSLRVQPSRSTKGQGKQFSNWK